MNKNLLYLETLLDGLIKKLNNDPCLAESARELKREKKNNMNLVVTIKSLYAN